MHPRQMARKILSVVVFLGSVTALPVFGQLGLPAAGQTADEISYSMPAGWVAQALQGGPELKAHYVLQSTGRSFAEMYLTQSAAPAGQSLHQTFEDALATLRPQLPYYQARGTQDSTVAGVPAVIHEFSYMPPGAGVLFIARTYTLISGSTVFTFFFQSVEGYFPSTQGYFSQVMAGVKIVPKIARVNPGRNAAVPPVAAPDGGIVADDLGLNFELPAGWRLVDDPAGAKYRFFTPAGNLAASLFILEPKEMDGLTALFGGTEDETLKVALNEKIEREYKSYARYAPVATFDRQIGGYKGRVHDFTFLLNNHPAFYRSVVFLVPRKGDRPTVRVAPLVQSFGFLAAEAADVGESQRQWNAIMDSMQAKGAPRLVPMPVPAERGVQTPPRPRNKEEAGLPDLLPEEPEPGIYTEPFGRYKVPLPQGAVPLAVQEGVASFRMPVPKTTILNHSYEQEATGLREMSRVTEGRKLNGAQFTLTAGMKEARVGLYTARDGDGESMVWVVAHYPKSGLLITVNLPAKDYGGAKDWITALLSGVRF